MERVIGAALLMALGCSRPELPPAAESEEPVGAPVETDDSLGRTDEQVERLPTQAQEEAQASSRAEPAKPTEAKPPRAPQRDLAADLREAVGTPADCLQDYRPASVTTIRVEVSAVVRPSGLVIEPSASGPGLSVNDRRCIEERLGAVILEPLTGDASQAVSTYLAIRYEPPSAKEYDVAPPPPPPDDVVQPLPKKEPIAPSGKPIEGPAPDAVKGPSGVPIEGPRGVPISGPKPVPIESD